MCTPQCCNVFVPLRARGNRPAFTVSAHLRISQPGSQWNVFIYSHTERTDESPTPLHPSHAAPLRRRCWTNTGPQLRWETQKPAGRQFPHAPSHEEAVETASDLSRGCVRPPGGARARSRCPVWGAERRHTFRSRLISSPWSASLHAVNAIANAVNSVYEINKIKKSAAVIPSLPMLKQP